jgi:hypothetical protein
MLYSRLQRRREVHCLNARIVVRKEFEIRDVACMPPVSLAPDQEWAAQITEHCLQSCFSAGCALPGRNSDLDGFEGNHASSQFLDYRRRQRGWRASSRDRYPICSDRLIVSSRARVEKITERTVDDEPLIYLSQSGETPHSHSIIFDSRKPSLLVRFRRGSLRTIGVILTTFT